MTSPLGVGDLYRLLGVKSGVTPAITTADAQPVVVLQDFSRTLTSEPIEARGIAGSAQAADAINTLGFKITAIGGGGLVVETGFWLVSAGNFIVSKDSSAALATTPGSVDIGGLPTTAILEAGPIVINGATLPGPSISLTGLRWFIGPGETLTVGTTNINVSLTVCIVWRELPQAIPAP